MTYQEYFNILLGLVAFVGSWWMKAVWSSIAKHDKSDAILLEKINGLELLIANNFATKADLDKASSPVVKRLDKIENVEVLIATHYVTKEDFSKVIETLFLKLDRIEEKLDKKADK